ncbi:MAG: MFS transporter [Nitrospirae bacterium]|nr:MFS transporter [Nitrospirota bacterium]
MEDKKGRLFLRLCLSGFLAFLSYSLSRFPVIPLYAESLGVGPKAIGLIVAASTITGIFGKFLSGGLSDIYGRRRLLIAGLLVFAFAPYLYLLVNGYISLLVIRFIHGSATAIFGPVVSAIISDIVEKERRGERLATYSSAAMIGNTIGPWLGGILISAGGFTYPFLASGIAGIAALISVFRWPETIHKTTPGDLSNESGGQQSAVRRKVWILNLLNSERSRA